MPKWTNWSGGVVATPAQLIRPRVPEDVSAAVVRARKVRLVGAGHSFTPLCATNGTLIDLGDLEGGIEIAPDRQSAWIPAGWSLANITERLWRDGLSLANQGDVNPQSLAGAVSTGTHGTGETLGSLSTQVLAARLVTAQGVLVECDPTRDPELFEAARLALGLVGVIVALKVRLLPAYHLEERIERRPLAEVLEAWDDIVAARRHVEFWVLPYADHVLLKQLHPVAPGEPYIHRNDVDEASFRLLCRIARRVPALIPVLHRSMTRLIGGPKRRVGPAWQIFPQTRSVRFEEMEYEVPRAQGVAALKEAIDRVRRLRLPKMFPFEFRTVAGDDIWMSPFHAGPACSISAHQFAGMPWQGIFSELEAVFQGHGGRPHWGKRHGLGSRDVADLYPRLADFLSVRRRVDPDGKFVNPSLGRLFDIGCPA